MLHITWRHTLTALLQTLPCNHVQGKVIQWRNADVPNPKSQHRYAWTPNKASQPTGPSSQTVRGRVWSASDFCRHARLLRVPGLPTLTPSLSCRPATHPRGVDIGWPLHRVIINSVIAFLSDSFLYRRIFCLLRSWWGVVVIDCNSATIPNLSFMC